MGIPLFLLVLSCVPDPNRICPRVYRPVCAEGTREFGNLCQAEAEGYIGECAVHVKQGKCAPVPEQRAACAEDQVRDEASGECIPKPWSDFHSCEEEQRQGACPGGSDPNPWVGEHCSVTCGA